MAALTDGAVSNMVVAMLKADTGTLYGRGKYISLDNIINDEVYYDDGKVDISNPYRLFLAVESNSPGEVRMHNRDYTVTIKYRIEGLSGKLSEATERLDNIDTRLSYLVNNQMWSGNYFTGYFTNTECTIIDAVIGETSSGITNENNQWRAHSEGSIAITVNYIP